MAENVTATANPANPHPRRINDDPASHKTQWWVWLIALGVIVLLVALVNVLRRPPPKPRQPPPTAITETNVQQGDIQVAVTALGSVIPVYTDIISPRVDGQLISVDYTEGQMVKTNDLLAVIDPRPYTAALTQASGQLERDKALLEGAQVDLQRYQTAYLKNAIPKQQLDDEVALVHQDEGTVKYDEGQVAAAKVQVDYCYIHAPISGRVGLRLIDPGNVVHAANTNPIVVITQLEPITVVFSITEDDLPKVQRQLQQGAVLTVEAYDRDQIVKLATGTLLTLDNQIDVATGTIRMKAEFANQDLSLFPNQFVNARLIIETIHNATLVPSFAIQRNPEGTFVYLVTPTNTVTMRNITTSTVENDITQVTAGLQPGDRIAVDNFNKLGEGVKITSSKPGQGNAQNPSAGHKKSRHAVQTGAP